MHDFAPPPYAFSHYKGKRVHLGVCGSVAAFRAPDLLRWWLKSGLSASVTLTPAARRFVGALTFEALGALPVYTDMFQSDGPFGHLEPGQTAQAMIIAPTSATTLARLAQGLGDELLACQALAFDGPLVIAPAMNPRMWCNAATQENVEKLRQRGATLVLPDTGGTACGDEGQGRLADLRQIWMASLKALTPQDMAGMKVLLTLGPTREQWDAVRFWSNPSTGSMGAALAVAAWLRGAEVHAVCGPVHGIWMPGDIARHDVRSAAEMFTAAQDLWPGMNAGLFTAAVADFSPEPHGKEKFKKAGAEAGFSVHFTPNADILKTLAAHRRPDNPQKVLGFAAETVEDLPEAVRVKLRGKGADIVAGNRIGQSGAGFGSATNVMAVADAHGREEQWPSLSKADVAWRLCSWLLEY